MAWTDVYTDGACSGNPGPGGWAWVVDGGDSDSGFEPDTTNQRMEVRAVLEALRSLDGSVAVYSDSTYVVNCFKDRWFEGWKKRGWKNSQRKPVANRDLWEPLLETALPRFEAGELRFEWVKGHSGHPLNDMADRLAVQAIEDHRALGGVGRVDTGTSHPAAVSTAEAGVPWPIGPALVVIGATTVDDDQIRVIRSTVASLGPDAIVVSGLRRGAELIAAEAALERRIPLAAVLPFPDPASRWPDDVRSRFDAALARAEWEVVVDDEPADGAIRRRNHWLERAALGALVVGDPDLAERLVAGGLSVIEA